MRTNDLKNLQAPLKDRYNKDPATALFTLKAAGKMGMGVSCKVAGGKGIIEAGLHPATGGSGSLACSGDLLLEALVACAGVTLSAVATAIEIELKDADITAEGDLDFRGTLGVSKEAQVGFKAIRLKFVIDCDAGAEKLATLLRLTERYCVVYQTLSSGVATSATIEQPIQH